MRNLLFLSMLMGVVSVLMTSCSVTRHVPEGVYLLNRTRITIEDKDQKVDIAHLHNYVRQRPNTRWLSMARLPLATYSLSGRDSLKWFNKMFRSMGEAPVIYDSLLAVQTCTDLEQELHNQGFLHAKVKLYPRPKGRKMNVDYMLQLGEPYFIDSVEYHIADEHIQAVLDLYDHPSERLIKPGMKFDAATLDAERKRIASILTDNGYYRFHKEYITYVADTMAASRMITVGMYLHPYVRPDMPDTLHPQFRLRRINYSSGDPYDNQIHLRRHVLAECTHMEEGKPYSATALQQTFNHFGRMQAVKYTNISFEQVKNTDSLDCNIQLLTNKPSTLSFQPEGTNTAGDLGAAASLTYQNRNLFKGSEVFSVELRGAYEAIRGLEGYSERDFVEYSAETRLAFPRFIVPFIDRDLRRRLNATSEVSVSYDMQNRPEYHRRVLSAAWKYRWHFPDRRDRYQLDLLDLNYLFMPWISDTFRSEYLENESSRNAILTYNYVDLFITKIGFGYSYSNRAYALKTNVETSGNLLSFGSRLFRVKKDANDQYRLFNIAFAQYAKFDFDLTRSFQFDPVSQLVLHLGVGVAYPYGNSTILPFEKRYFSGGANSVRGWSVRSLGPGKYKEKDGRINFINQTGDMKLDLNAEYRTHLFWKLGAALFFDAGNIWTIRNYDGQPGGQFELSQVLNQLAVSYGLGIRFNFDYFILRFDLGMKAVNPSFEIEDEEHYPLIHPRFSRDCAFHFAVGLPF